MFLCLFEEVAFAGEVFVAAEDEGEENCECDHGEMDLGLLINRQ